jgi:DNA-binding ferritin-like protein
MGLLSNLTADKALNPDKIIGWLFYFHSQAHFNHLQTTSFARHKALDELYKELVDFKDDIGELLLGYIAPKRFGKFETIPVTTISDENLVDKIASFADSLYEYGESTEWWELSNKAADLNGLARKTKYFLTLS